MRMPTTLNVRKCRVRQSLGRDGAIADHGPQSFRQDDGEKNEEGSAIYRQEPENGSPTESLRKHPADDGAERKRCQ